MNSQMFVYMPDLDEIFRTLKYSKSEEIINMLSKENISNFKNIFYKICKVIDKGASNLNSKIIVNFGFGDLNQKSFNKKIFDQFMINPESGEIQQILSTINVMNYIIQTLKLNNLVYNINLDYDIIKTIPYITI